MKAKLAAKRRQQTTIAVAASRLRRLLHSCPVGSRPRLYAATASRLNESRLQEPLKQIVRDLLHSLIRPLLRHSMP